MALVLGIDPGTATTGFGLVQDRMDGGLECVGFGTIQTPAGMAAHKRLSVLYHHLIEILLLHKPNSCSVEKLFFKRNISTAISVGQARGVMMLAISEAGLEMTEYSPNEVKQAVAGYGSAGKKQVQEMVRVLLELPETPKPDDAADALAIAITHLNTQRYRDTLDSNLAR
jgi:crossover junction endodeoxyribonuclease RuvC